MARYRITGFALLATPIEIEVDATTATQARTKMLNTYATCTAETLISRYGVERDHMRVTRIERVDKPETRGRKPLPRFGYLLAHKVNES
jgi:hypothetical protein